MTDPYIYSRECWNIIGYHTLKSVVIYQVADAIKEETIFCPKNRLVVARQHLDAFTQVKAGTQCCLRIVK